MGITIDEYYFYACEYMAKTELYDRTLTNERSPFDPTSALEDLVNEAPTIIEADKGEA